MEQAKSRDRLWAQLDQSWDVVVIGGGITGAGILREATRAGLRVLMVEQRDFGWGTSSRSSKLVHGGLRYLQEARLLFSLELVKERDRLLAECPDLIEPLGFLIPTYKGDFSRRWIYKLGLTIYDLFGWERIHRFHGSSDFQMLAPRIAHEGLRGGYCYRDARTDDARLVLRVIKEAVADGAVAMNYVKAEGPVRVNGNVAGVCLRDTLTGREADVNARVVINASGTWADELRVRMGKEKRIRPLRGSHLVIPRWRLPVAQAISLSHPLDHRYVYVLPWEGATIVGTTDLDHEGTLEEEPAISAEEASYLMVFLHALFPSLDLTFDDVISTFSGVRAVVGTGKANPSKESRDHVIWKEEGLLTVTGGKLTNFRLIAFDVLRTLRRELPVSKRLHKNMTIFNAANKDLSGGKYLGKMLLSRLRGRYGENTQEVIEAVQAGDLETIGDTQTTWAELRWAARNEWVVHLEDLLLRRVRIGLLLPKGGAEFLPEIRTLCQPELGWDDARWEAEEKNYLELYRRSYGVPD